MTDALNTTEEQALLDQYVRNQLQMKELAEQNDDIKLFFKDRLDQGRHNKGKFYVNVTSNTRVDDSLAREVLESSDYERLSKKVIDGPKAKKSLTGEQYAAIVKTYDNKIEIGMR